MNTNQIKRGITNQSIKLALVSLFFLNANSCFNVGTPPSSDGTGSSDPQPTSATSVSSEDPESPEEQQRWEKLAETQAKGKKASPERIKALKAYIKEKPNGISDLNDFLIAIMFGRYVEQEEPREKAYEFIVDKLLDNGAMETTFDVFEPEMKISVIATNTEKKLGTQLMKEIFEGLQGKFPNINILKGLKKKIILLQAAGGSPDTIAQELGNYLKEVKKLDFGTLATTEFKNLCGA